MQKTQVYIHTYRAAILSTYETIYTILKKNADTIDKICNNPMIKNIVNLARKDKVALKPPVLEMAWDIIQVFQLWYDFPSPKALTISKIRKCESKIRKCEGLVLQLVRAPAVALFRLDTSTRSGDIYVGVRLYLPAKVMSESCCYASVWEYHLD
jgi:hypothetical protein